MLKNAKYSYLAMLVMGKLIGLAGLFFSYGYQGSI